MTAATAILEGENRMPTESQKNAYDNIIKLYDNAEYVIKLAEQYPEDSQKIIRHIEKFVDSVEKNAEIVMDCFETYMKSGKVLSGVEKLKIEKALKALVKAREQFQNELK